MNNPQYGPKAPELHRQTGAVMHNPSMGSAPLPPRTPPIGIICDQIDNQLGQVASLIQRIEAYVCGSNTPIMPPTADVPRPPGAEPLTVKLATTSDVLGALLVATGRIADHLGVSN